MFPIKKTGIWFVSLLCLLVTILTPAALYAEHPVGQVRIGVLAKRGYEKALEKWGPTAQYLTKEIPSQYFTIVPLDFEEIETSVIKAEVDFLVTNSAYYVLLEENHGLSRIATLRNRWNGQGYQIFGGVIITRSDNDTINNIFDLKGKIFMAVDPHSFGGWLMARFEFHKNGIDTDKKFKALLFGTTHDKVVFAVRNKTVDAGTVRTDTLERMAAEGMIDLKDIKIIQPKPTSNSFPFLRSTELYPEWPFAKLSHTPNELAEQVTIALLNMPAQSPAATAAGIAGWTIPLDYRPVHHLMRELKIGPYKYRDKITLIDMAREYLGWIIAAVLLLIFMTGISLYVSILNKKLKTARLKVEKANDELEDKVKNRTKELLESERKYKIVADNTYNWEFWLNPEREFVYCSPSCIQITGYDSNAFINNPELLLSLVHPDDIALSNKHREDEKAYQKTERIEFRIIDASGNEHWVEHVCKPIFIQGEYLGCRASNRDITSNKLMDNKLKLQLEFEKLCSELSGEFVNLPLDGINSAIEKCLLKVVQFVNVDWGGIIQIKENQLVVTHSVGVSEASLLKNIEIDDVLPWISGRIKAGETLIFKRLPDDLPKEAFIDTNFIIQERLLSNIMTPLNPDGQLIGSIAFSSFSRYIDWSTEIGGRLRLVGEILGHAILRQKNAEKNRKLQEQLWQTQKMEAIGILAGGIAHDFNNILSSIFGFTELSQIGLKKGEDIKAFLERIMDVGMRARELVQHLLTFSRRAEVTRAPVDLLPMVKESLKFIRATLPSTIEIRQDIQDVRQTVMADQIQIHQILMNLFTNAGHAMREKGGILNVGFEEYSLETDVDQFKGLKKGRYIKISVCDTGYGIPKNILNKIFDPFFTTKKRGEGTGMGLFYRSWNRTRHGRRYFCL